MENKDFDSTGRPNGNVDIICTDFEGVYLKLEAVSPEGHHILSWIASDGIDGSWDGHIMIVAVDGNEADRVMSICGPQCVVKDAPAQELAWGFN